MGFLNELFGAKNNNFANNTSNYGNGQEYDQRIRGLANQLTEQSLGNGPTLADQQLQKSANQVLNQQGSAIGSVKGINPALAAKMIAENSANHLQDTAGQAGMMRNKEQMDARGQLAGVLGNERNRLTQESLGVQGINAQVGAGNAGQNAKTGGGFLSALGGMVGLADGGEVPASSSGLAAHAVPAIMAAMAKGGDVKTHEPLIDLGGMLRSGIQSLFGSSPEAAPGAGMAGTTSQDYANMYGAPSATEQSNVGSGGAPTSFDWASMMGAPGGAGGGGMKEGGKVPGKAKVAGDSKENDTVLTLLSPGEEVIPRSAAGDPKLEKEFLAHLHKSKEKKGSGKAGYAKVVQAQQHLHNRISDLEKMAYGGSAA